MGGHCMQIDERIKIASGRSFKHLTAVDLLPDHPLAMVVCVGRLVKPSDILLCNHKENLQQEN